MTRDATGPPVHHLHPTSILFGLAGIVRRLVVPLIFVVLFSRGRDSSFFIWAMALIGGPSLIYELIRYATTRVRYEGDEIIVNRGLIFRSERHIPYNRIQNIDIVQNVFHRICRVAIVKIETSSGSDAEAELKVLSVAAIETMRERVFADRVSGASESHDGSAASAASAEGQGAGDPAASLPGTAPRPPDAELVRLKTGDLIQVGLITNRGIALLAVAIGVGFEQLDIVERFTDVMSFLERFEAFAVSSRVITVGLIAFAIALLYLLSVIWSILRFHDFRLTRHGEDLRIACGLLTRVGATVPRRRIQFITVRRTPLHRLFGKAAIRIETAGGNIRDDEMTLLSRKWFVPILPVDDVPALIDRVQPDFTVDGAEWHPLDPRAARRRMRVAFVVWTAIGALAFIWLPIIWSALIVIALAVLGTAHARALARRTRWTVTPHGIALHTGVITQTTSVTPFRCIQTAGVLATPFDRRWRMAALDVDTAGAGTAGQRISIRDLPAATADALREDLAAQAEAAGFEWA